jgi:hypothetical protein
MIVYIGRIKDGADVVDQTETAAPDRSERPKKPRLDEGSVAGQIKGLGEAGPIGKQTALSLGSETAEHTNSD